MFNKSVIVDFLWRSGYVLTKQGLLFLIFIVSAFTLSVEHFGVYNYLLSAIYFLVLLSDFGISTSTAKYVAQYSDTNNQGKLSAVISTVFTFLMLVSLLISVVAILLGEVYFADLYTYFLYTIPLIFLIPATSVYDGFLRGQGKFKEVTVVSLRAFVVCVPLSSLLIFEFGLAGALVSQGFFYAILLIFYLIGHTKTTFIFDFSIAREIANYSLLYGVAVIGYQVFARVDVLFLGHYGYIDQIAVYELINKIFALIIIPFTLFGQVIAPRFTKLFYHQKDYAQIIRYVKQYTVALAFIGLAFSMLMYFLLPELVNLWLPKYYNEYFFALLLPCSIILGLQVSAATIDHGILVPTGYAKLMTWSYAILAFTNILLNFYLIPIFGYIGSVYATVFCLILMVIILRALFFMHLKRKSVTNNI